MRLPESGRGAPCGRPSQGITLRTVQIVVRYRKFHTSLATGGRFLGRQEKTIGRGAPCGRPSSAILASELRCVCPAAPPAQPRWNTLPSAYPSHILPLQFPPILQGPTSLSKFVMTELGKQPLPIGDTSHQEPKTENSRKSVSEPAHRTLPYNLSELLTFRTVYCNYRIVPAHRPLSSLCTGCSPAKEHRYVHVALFHLPARSELPPPAQGRRPPGVPHSYCRSILMRTKCRPCGRNPPKASTLLHLSPARPGRPHRSLQRHRRTGLARQQQLAQPETILNLVRRYHRKQWLRHPPRPPE